MIKNIINNNFNKRNSNNIVINNNKLIGDKEIIPYERKTQWIDGPFSNQA